MCTVNIKMVQKIKKHVYMTCDFAQFSGKLHGLTLQLYEIIVPHNQLLYYFQFNNNLIGGTLKRMKSSYS